MADKKALICEAIREKRLLQFCYENDNNRIVEPHQLAFNQNDAIMLSAWFVRGFSASGDAGNGWREYRYENIISVVLLEEYYLGPRPGYKRTPNKRFHSAICQL